MQLKAKGNGLGNTDQHNQLMDEFKKAHQKMFKNGQRNVEDDVVSRYIIIVLCYREKESLKPALHQFVLDRKFLTNYWEMAMPTLRGLNKIQFASGVWEFFKL